MTLPNSDTEVKPGLDRGESVDVWVTQKATNAQAAHCEAIAATESE